MSLLRTKAFYSILLTLYYKFHIAKQKNLSAEGSILLGQQLRIQDSLAAYQATSSLITLKALQEIIFKE